MRFSRCAALFVFALAASLFSGSTPSWAQTATEPRSTPPAGINDRFLDETVDPAMFVSMFESDGREIYAHRHEIVDSLQLEPGMEVADIGAGTGFFARMIAQRIGQEGTVFAVDISKSMLEHIERKNRELGIDNVRPVLGQLDSSGLEAGSVDLVFLCDTYHHFDRPDEMLQSIRTALRPGGMLVVVDFERVVGVSPDFAIGHIRAGKGTFTDEIRDRAFDYIDEVPLMKDQYVLRFRKR